MVLVHELHGVVDEPRHGPRVAEDAFGCVGTLDGFLVCLDAATGKLIWKADTFIDRVAFYTIKGPPQIAKGKVVIGNSGAEYGHAERFECRR